MAFRPGKKQTLLIPSGPPNNPDQLHLHVILTDQCEDALHLVVSVATVKAGQFHDKTCILKPGEHPFIKNETYVEYRRVAQHRSNHISKCVDGWLYKPHEQVSDELFARICAGVEISEFTSNGMKKYFRSQTKK